MTISKGSTIYQAVENLVPNGKFCVRDNVLEWLGASEDKPSDSDVANEVTRLESEYDSKQYQRDREPEYPPIADYLDGIVKNDTGQVDKYVADCLAVKVKYPKPE